MKIKEGDVFSFRYKPEVEKEMFEPYHCFDGQLVARKDKDGKIILEDTFWGLYYPSNRTFTPEKAEAKGTLKYRFNLNEVKIGTESDLNYYDDNDVFPFNYQHGSHRRVYVRKDAKKSKEKMLEVVNRKIKDEKKKIEKSIEELIKLSEIKLRIKMGDLDVYI